MKRIVAAIKTDVITQYRNKLYAIAVIVGVIVAIPLSQLASPATMPAAVPTVLLLIVGGSTLFYIGALILFERDEGSLTAVVVSPLRMAEYLWAKIITLGLLATIESVVIIAGAMLIMSWSAEIPIPDILILLAGIIGLGVIYTLAGIILIVRHRSITDFLIPMAGISAILQLPFLHFLGVVEHPLFLIIPTSAPTMLMQGAYLPLEIWEWLYGLIYTALAIAGLILWAFRAFRKHILLDAGGRA